MNLRRHLFVSTSLFALAAAPAAMAADLGYPAPAVVAPAAGLPAVSAPNGKLDIRGGAINGDWAGFAVGSYSLPLGFPFGLQIDGEVGSVGGDAVAAVGGHLFWRDPRFGLFGIYGDYGYDGRLGGLYIGRAAAEAELYLGRFTFSGLAGQQFGDAPNGFFGKAALAFYATDNFKLNIGYQHLPTLSDRVSFGAEALVSQTGSTGFSIFGEGRTGGGDWSGLAGIRIYTGPSKSLIDRQRRDDPSDHFDLFNDAASGVTGSVKTWQQPEAECNDMPDHEWIGGEGGYCEEIYG
jgi:hypothetical protein